MKNIWKLSAALGVVAVGAAGCGGGSGTFGNGGGNNGGGTTGPQLFTQQERLARPVVNEVLATVAERRHSVNNLDNPTDDAGQLKSDIDKFLTFPAGRGQATKDFIESVLVPDVMKVDLAQQGPASYLGLEIAGLKNGSAFGGRKLQDDVVDTSLGVVFGNTVAALGGPDDGVNLTQYSTDNVDSSGHNYSDSFPYLEAPQ